MKNLLVFFALAAQVSCIEPAPDVPPSQYTFGGGVFLVNEGNFNAGNGSLSFYSYDSTKIFNDLFEKANGRPLGDVPNSIVVYGGKVYIVVNNSGKIEIIDQNTFKSDGTITGLISPRNMAVLNDSKACVTSLYSDSVAVIDMRTKVISGYINLGRTSEAIAVRGSTVHVSNWINGDKILNINGMDNRIFDSVTVGREPESMVFDRFDRLWVLCTGGWEKKNPAELDIIDLYTYNVVKKFVFPLQDSPSCLKIDGMGQTLYFLNKGVRKMDVNADALPGAALIPEIGSSFYKLAVNPVNSDIFVTDVADYMQKGNLQIYKNDGSFVSKNTAGIIPGSMYFKLTINSK